METIIIMGVDGVNVDGTKWTIREGQRDLETVGTKKEALIRARGKWAAPKQGIKVVNTRGNVEWVRKGKRKNTQRDGSNDDSMMMTGSGGGSGGSTVSGIGADPRMSDALVPGVPMSDDEDDDGADGPKLPF